MTRHHDATQAILRPLSHSPSGGPDTVPFALDTQSRLKIFPALGNLSPLNTLLINGRSS